MPSRLPHLVLALLLLGTSQALSRPDDLPYAGTWKITVPNQNLELTLWLVQFDRQVRKPVVVSGFQQYAKSKISDVKADGKGLAFTLGLERIRYQFTILPPSAGDGKRMLGSMQVGSNLLPVWMEKTDLEELTQKTALRETPGSAELVAARKMVDPRERLAEIKAVAKAQKGKPGAFLALQMLLAELIRTKSDTPAFKEPVEEYRKLSAAHGTEFLIGANQEMARHLLAYPKAVPLAVESAREAIKHFAPGQPVGLKISVQLTLAAGLQQLGKTEETVPVAQTLKKLSEEAVKSARGDDATLEATGQMASLFLASPAAAVADLGLEYARRAVTLVKADAPAARRAGVQKFLARALVARGKGDEAKKLQAGIDKLEAEADVAYRKEAIPFEVTKHERKGKSGRVVLVELFTGAQYRQATAAGIAFEAGLKTFASKDVVFLQYPVTFAQPDVLANQDSDRRKDDYKGDLEGVPSMFVDGKLTVPLGGARVRGKNSFDLMRERILEALETNPGARIALQVTRKGDTISARADLSDVKEPGAKVRLRFALVETEVRHPGASGIRLHSHVVRAFMGGVDGFKVDKKEATWTALVNLTQLKKDLDSYLTATGKKHNLTWVEKPMRLDRLAVIAFLQDDDSKQVYQAAQAIVPEK